MLTSPIGVYMTSYNAEVVLLIERGAQRPLVKGIGKGEDMTQMLRRREVETK